MKDESGRVNPIDFWYCSCSPMPLRPVPGWTCPGPRA